ncbi:uncharacterized protein TNIN_132401 [Trichonephila inaurata madagascariensis]|uniref:Uncharacterized protein n=1 Tax=Trichonephila inaurata madagascariensis TaxID=2747483 RepID=A0A8X7BYS1_9ARAC|nr:uncharacterized protein TNIN_132401 [Trichonephila inaurata madagascariensis]
MSSWVLIFAACVATAFAGGLHHDESDVGEYGNYNEWRKVMCEKASDDLYKDMDACFKLESKMMDECFAEYEANVEFKKQMELKPEVKACYEEILKKYEMTELMHYLEESSHEGN